MLNKTIVEGLQPYAFGRETPDPAAAKEHGAGGTGQAHRPFGGDALKTGTWQTVSHTPHAATYRFGVRSGARILFTDERKRHVVAIARKEERLRFPDSPGGGCIAYDFESLDFKATERKLNAFYAEFEPISSDNSRPHQHLGVELLYVISGKLELTIASETFTLEAGDAVYFDSGVRHSYHRARKGACAGVIVTA